MAWNRNPYSFGDRTLEKDRFDRSLAEKQRQFDDTHREGQYQYRRSQGELEDQFDNTFGEGQYRYRRSQGEVENQFAQTHDLETDKFIEHQYQYDRTQGEHEDQFDIRTDYDYNVLDQDWMKQSRDLQHDWNKFVPDARIRQGQWKNIQDDRATYAEIVRRQGEEYAKEQAGDERFEELNTGPLGWLKTLGGQITGELPTFTTGNPRDAVRYDSRGIPTEGLRVTTPTQYNLMGLTTLPQHGSINRSLSNIEEFQP